jgi:hypothetical protein
VLPDDWSRQAALQRQIEEWDEAMNALLLSDSMSKRDIDAAKVLRIHQMIMRIWLGTCCNAEECWTDRYMPEFEAAVTLGESIMANLGTFEERQKYSTTFLFDMEVVSPLYFVGIKCRHPQLRRRAISMLRSSQRREGLWDSDMAAAIAERIAELEEANLSVLDGSDLPLEKDRIHNTHIHSMAGMGPNTHHLTIFTKPNGLDKDFKVWEEAIQYLEKEKVTRVAFQMLPDDNTNISTLLGPGRSTPDNF